MRRLSMQPVYDAIEKTEHFHSGSAEQAFDAFADEFGLPRHIWLYHTTDNLKWCAHRLVVERAVGSQLPACEEVLEKVITDLAEYLLAKLSALVRLAECAE